MTALFSRWLPCATLTLWSLVLLYYAEAQGVMLKWMSSWSHLFSGRVDAFLIPAFRPFVLVAGLLMLLMALVFVFFPADAECCQASDCAHPLSRFSAGRWLSFLILVLPVAVTAFTSPDGFSKNTMMNRGITTDAAALPERVAPSASAAQVTPAAPVSITSPLSLPLPVSDAESSKATAQTGSPAPAAEAASATELKDYLVRTPEGYIAAEVLDLLYAAQDNTLRKDFEGKKVQLIGQLMPDTSKNGGDHRFKAVRMFMTCCAADARPVATIIEGAAKPTLPEMTWIKIVGIATFPVENGRRTAVLKAETVEKTEPPAESMLY